MPKITLNGSCTVRLDDKTIAAGQRRDALVCYQRGQERRRLDPATCPHLAQWIFDGRCFICGAEGPGND